MLFLVEQAFCGERRNTNSPKNAWVGDYVDTCAFKSNAANDFVYMAV